MSEAIVVALITGALAVAGNLLVSWRANSRTSALILYRLEQLEEKVGKHNNVIERVYELERHNEVQDEKHKVTEHRLEDLERQVEKRHG